MYTVMARFGVGDPGWLDPVAVFIGIVVSLVAAGAFDKLIFPLLMRLTQWTPTDLDTRMVRATRRPFIFGIVLLGVYLTLTLLLDLSLGQRERVDQVVGLLGILMGVVIVVSLVSNALDWYLENLASRTEHLVDLKLFPLLRRISVVLIYGLGGLLILDLLNINISPLIAGLGLGGLAVALALQPTLANLFAGTYVMTEGAISPGDYIALEGGITGYVVDVGWRSTRVRTWQNNMVVVPNNRFAETIITNYQQPAPAVNVFLQCGVSYDSDLQRVQQVCEEVMDHILETEPQADKEYGSYFGYDSFGDSNVNFWLFLQARDRSASFVVQTELMKQLHARFKKEDITINYPMRTLEFPKEWGTETMASGNGREATRGANGRNLRRRAKRRRPSREFHLPLETGDDAGAGDGPLGGG